MSIFKILQGRLHQELLLLWVIVLCFTFSVVNVIIVIIIIIILILAGMLQYLCSLLICFLFTVGLCW